MKKTTNSNPLKYFNDAAAARAKSVNAGNNKLVKAQVGVVKTPEQMPKFREATNIYQGPLDESTSKYGNIYYPSTAGKNLPPADPGTKKVQGVTKEALGRWNMENKLRGMNSSSNDYYGDSPEDEAKRLGRTVYKKGGAIKSKKK
jgi:hypothetical protein